MEIGLAYPGVQTGAALVDVVIVEEVVVEGMTVVDVEDTEGSLEMLNQGESLYCQSVMLL